MLSQFTRKNKSHRSLDLARCDGRLLVVTSKSRRFLRKLFEDVIDEAVHDAHGLAGDPDIRVNLLQNLEDVDLVGLNDLLHPLLLLVSSTGAGLFGSFLPAFGFFSAGAFSAGTFSADLFLYLWRH